MIYIQQEIIEFTYSNIVDTVTTYNLATDYAIGAEVRLGNLIYKSTATPNIGHDPIVNIGVYWIEWGPSNTYALLDLEQDTVTTWAGNGIIKFTRGAKDSIGIGNYNASGIRIEYLDALDVVVGIQEFTTSVNLNVYDEWDYGYSGFTIGQTGNIYVPILRVGTYIRITLLEVIDGGCSCGFLVAGKMVSMGLTKDEVLFPDKRIGSRTISVANFQTIVPKVQLMRKSIEAKKLIDIPMMFVIDESTESSHDNIIILGKISKCDAVGASSPINYITWEVEQFITGVA